MRKFHLEKGQWNICGQNHVSFALQEETPNAEEQEVFESAEDAGYVKFFTKDGKDCSSKDEYWAYVNNDNEPKYYIITSKGTPKHKQFSVYSTNDKFKICSKDIFEYYVSYLSTDNQGQYKKCKTDFQLQGYAS